MNKIRIIDLLNKIANYEETPVKIKFKGKEYEWSYEFFDYKCIDINHKFLIEDLETEDLNKMCEEIPIIEDKKIEKLNENTFGNNRTFDEVDSDIDFIVEKVNEIIDKLNKEE